MKVRYHGNDGPIWIYAKSLHSRTRRLKKGKTFICVCRNDTLGKHIMMNGRSPDVHWTRLTELEKDRPPTAGSLNHSNYFDCVIFHINGRHVWYFFLDNSRIRYRYSQVRFPTCGDSTLEEREKVLPIKTMRSLVALVVLD